MARSTLTSTSQDLIDDAGNVLWSFIKGEQLEYPITLNFISDAALYTYEAVIVEADNLDNQTSAPKTIKPGGVQTTLVVRVPTYIGIWSAGGSYNAGELVLYNSVYYMLTTGTARVNATPPDSDSAWIATTKNKIYIQFPETLGSTWENTPIVGSPVYGFFELRVTEPATGVYQHTWKPVRGLVEILFSPTDIVP